MVERFYENQLKVASYFLKKKNNKSFIMDVWQSFKYISVLKTFSLLI